MSSDARRAGQRPGGTAPRSSQRRRRQVRALVLLAGLCALGVGAAVGLSENPAEGERGAGASGRSGTDGSPASAGSGTPGSSASGRTSDGRTVRLAFGGDVHFEGSAAAALTTGLPTVRSMLGGADIAMVNLETAITTRGTPGPKQFVFRAPPQALRVLRDAGVDVVTVANNHGMDYGRTGLDDTLRAARDAGLPLVGAGPDAATAFAPWTTTVHGLRIAVLAATDVLDTFAQTTWVAGPATSGLATAKDPAPLLAAVRSAAGRADVVVVYLHWGKELQSCPSERQRTLARQLAAAGADVVVGSHAHVLQPGGRVANAWVQYGLGNFVFYARTPQTRRSGVLTVDVATDGVRGTRWTPATITKGVPEPGTTGPVPSSTCPL